MIVSAEELAQIEKEFKAGGRIIKINDEEKKLLEALKKSENFKKK